MSERSLAFHPFDGEAHDNISAALTHIAKAIEHLEMFQRLTQRELNNRDQADIDEFVKQLQGARNYLEHLGT
jgi:hypothetical protein